MSDSIAFDRAVDYYDATRGFEPEQERVVIDALATALGQLDGRVLEIGIGTGRIAIPLQQHGYHYYGVDLSMPMMRRLRENVAMRSKHIFPLAQGDITRLPYNEGAFAAIVAVHVFHLVPRWHEALAECRRVLRAGGILLHAGSRTAQVEGAVSRIPQKWRELLQAAGYADRSIGSRRIAPQINEALTQLGASAVDTQVALSWAHPRTPRQAYERLASRQWSGTWAVPDDLFARTMSQLYDWIIQEYGDRLDTPEQDGQEFFITRAVF